MNAVLLPRVSAAALLPQVAIWKREQAEHWFLHGHLHQWAEAFQEYATALELCDNTQAALAACEHEPFSLPWFELDAQAFVALTAANRLERRHRQLRSLVDYRLGLTDTWETE